MVISENQICHYNLHSKEETRTENWLPSGKLTVGITAGASCPNNLIEDVIRRIVELKAIPLERLYGILGIQEVQSDVAN